MKQITARKIRITRLIAGIIAAAFFISVFYVPMFSKIFWCNLGSFFISLNYVFHPYIFFMPIRLGFSRQQRYLHQDRKTQLIVWMGIGCIALSYFAN